MQGIRKHQSLLSGFVLNRYLDLNKAAAAQLFPVERNKDVALRIDFAGDRVVDYDPLGAAAVYKRGSNTAA